MDWILGSHESLEFPPESNHDWTGSIGDQWRLDQNSDWVIGLTLKVWALMNCVPLF